jgi:general secretion pathway protein D
MELLTFRSLSSMPPKLLLSCLSIVCVSSLLAEVESEGHSNFGIIENITPGNSSSPLLENISLSIRKQSSITREEVEPFSPPEEFFVQAAPPSIPPTATVPPPAPLQQPAPRSQPVQPAFPVQAVPQSQFRSPIALPVVPVPPRYPPPVGSPSSNYAFHSYRLSYMQSDRVLALLKALGYSTVEFSMGRGESLNENIFTAFQAGQRYPMIIKIIDAAKTSLMQPSLDGSRNVTGTDQLSGTYLHQSTTGAPEQRLLVIYEKNDPEQLNALLNLLRNDVDVPASQIVIEALVVEINSNKAKELGFKYGLVDKKTTSTIGQQANGSYGLNTSFRSDESSLFQWNGPGGTAATVMGTYVDSSGTTQYQYPGVSRINPLGFSATLDAFISDGTAEVLSNPTILVLDGRQALIRIGTQIPNETILTTSYGSQKNVTYINPGIVLNIRPRISEDGSEVTMQTETIVSSHQPDASNPDKAPQIETKTIQSFVRVADNTPFIVGGLIDKKKNKGFTGIPILSDIPVLGNLFKSHAETSVDREVIIVLTPHVINTSEKSFSYVIPKDSETFDSFNHLLFRNAYRIRDDDLFDLTFATQSKFYQDILKELRTFQKTYKKISHEEPIFDYLETKVPGEGVIVRRMIWEIVHKSKYHQYIADDHILLFESKEETKFGNKFKTHLLSLLLGQLEPKVKNSFIFDFADHKSKSAGPFEHPRALISTATVSDAANYIEQMSTLNADDPDRNRILLSSTVSPPGVRGATALEVLKGVLVLKRILSLNSSMPVTIDEFRVGRQIIFPTEQELKDKYHVIDYEVARFFYEVINYYPEFETAFNRDSASIILKMRGIE